MRPVSDLRIEQRDGVVTVTIDRPQTRNALTLSTLDALADLWRTVEDDDDVRVIVLTGAGDAAFSSGADLKDFADPAIRTRAGHAHAAFFPERILTKPVVAAVNGACLAGGCELLLATDIRLAVPTAIFGLPEPSLGFFPAGGSAVRAPRRLGWAPAMNLLLTGEAVDAHTALRIGLINRIVEPADLMHHATTIAGRIAAMPTNAVRAIKRAAIAADGLPLMQALSDQEPIARQVHENP